MPPTKLLSPQYVDMLTRWILAGMPQTNEEAAILSATATPTGAQPAAPSATPTP
jgi:hypothetical protein